MSQQQPKPGIQTIPILEHKQHQQAQQKKKQIKCRNQPSNINKSINLPIAHKINKKQIYIDQNIQDEQQNYKQLKIKRYDYLNKYNQHQIHNLTINTQKYRQDTFYNKYQRKNKQQKFNKKCKKFIGESLSKKKKITGSIYFSKPNSKRKYHDRSSSSSLQHQNQKKSPPPYFTHLQAYQTNNLKNKDILQDNLEPLPFIQPLQSPLPPLSVLQHIHETNSLSNYLSRIPLPLPLTTGLTKQLTYQNQMLRQQTNQYRCLVSKLQIDLKIARQQLSIIKQQSYKQKQHFYKIISNLQSKNQLLQNNQNQPQITYKTSNQMQNLSFQCHNKQNQHTHVQVNKPLSKIKQNFKNKSNHTKKQFCSSNQLHSAFLEKLSKLLNQKIKNIYHANNDHLPHLKHQEIIDRIQKLISKNRMYEDFLFNIAQMYRKIQKSHHPIQNPQNISYKVFQQMQPTLKQLWKWLKQLGYTYNLIQQIKPLLMQKIGIRSSDHVDLRQILSLIIINF